MRCVFSGSMGVQLGAAASPGEHAPVRNWRVAVHALQRCAQSFRNDALATTFPDDCRICAGPLTAWSTAPVCTRCIAAVTPQTAPLCAVCGEELGMESARFASAMGVTSCAACRLAPPAFARAVAYGTYDDQLRELIQMLKYEGLRTLAVEPLGRLLAGAVATLREQAAAKMLVVAVPLFPARERSRGFNQSVLLTDAAMARLRKTDPAWALTAAHGLLRRTRDTREQFALDPRQRRTNLRGAFTVTDAEAVHGREVLLVDDILTTGATARECARVLMRAGAVKVWVATVARAQANDFQMHHGFQENDHDGGVARWDAPPVDAQRTT